jgi:hypothetical protein
LRYLAVCFRETAISQARSNQDSQWSDFDPPMHSLCAATKECTYHDAASAECKAKLTIKSVFTHFLEHGGKASCGA